MTIFTAPKPRIFPTPRRRDQVAILEAQTRPQELPAPVIDVIRLRSQVRQLSDDDFRALMVSEAHARGMTGLWREMP
jgi:hypothetical protein